MALSADTLQELERRVHAGHYPSMDELVKQALEALDEVLKSEAEDRAWLEEALREGMEGEDVEMTKEDLDAMVLEAQENLRQRGIIE